MFKSPKMIFTKLRYMPLTPKKILGLGITKDNYSSWKFVKSLGINTEIKWISKIIHYIKIEVFY